jgi:predicted nucleic acid-binding protein
MTRMSDSICFDTAPLIWAIRGESARGQESQIEKTRRYIEQLTRARKQLMISAPVLAEYLVGASATEFHELEILKRGFQTPVLDIASARLAADLQRGNAVRAIQDDFGLPRQCIKIDALIIAIAITNKASKIITNDPHFSALARGMIPISSVPETGSSEIPNPPNLFGNQE